MGTLEKHLQAGAERGAIRFHVRLPMRFRMVGEQTWHEGWAETMSMGEILFRTNTALEAGKGLDIRVMLTTPQRSTGGGAIVGRAKVVRCFTVSDVPGTSFVTATLSSPHLLHYPAEDSRF
jgi:hypothetical protein